MKVIKTVLWALLAGTVGTASLVTGVFVGCLLHEYSGLGGGIVSFVGV